MADDFDPDAYLKRVKPAQPPAGSSSNGDDPFAATRESDKGLVTGVGKGLVGDAVGLGQVAERGVDYLAPGASGAVKRGLDAVVPGSSSALHATKEWTTAPSKSVSEGVGNVIGGALPFAFAGPAGLAGRVSLGALAGASQPTESGSLASHAAAAAAGGLGGAVLSPAVAERAARIASASGIMAAAEHVSRTVGISPWEALVAMGYPVYRLFHKPNAFSRGAEKAVGSIPGSVGTAAAGAAGGQAGGAAEQNVGQ